MIREDRGWHARRALAEAKQMHAVALPDQTDCPAEYLNFDEEDLA